MTEQQPQQPFDVATVLTAVRRRWWLVLLTALAAAAIALGLSLLQPERYQADASLLFREPQPLPRVNPSEPPPDRTETPERTAATNLALASLDRVALRVKQKLNTPLSINALRQQVELAPEGQADIVTITAQGKTAGEAASIANAFAGEVVTLRRENAQAQVQTVIDAIEAQVKSTPVNDPAAAALRQRADQLRIEKRLRSGDVEVAEAATPPRQRSSPQPLRNALIGAGLGLILGFLLALLLHRLDRRVESEDEIAEILGGQVIARIPEEKAEGWEKELFVEAFQFLRANLQLRDPEQHSRVIAVTSALPGNGKSTVSTRLAEALAKTGAEVIVVDFDLRRPTLHEYFGTTGRDGVTTSLVGLGNSGELVQQTSRPGIRLLAAGPLVPVSASVVAGEGPLKTMLDNLRKAADYVIIDTSPITIGAEALAVAAVAEATLVVVDPHSARRDVLNIAVDQLRTARANLTGVVLNRVEVTLNEHAYRGYYSAGASSYEDPAHAGGSAGEQRNVNGSEAKDRWPDRLRRRAKSVSSKSQ